MDLPQCLLGQHPRLRWNRRRRRRSLQLRQLRSVYLLRRQRELQRQLLEHQEHKNQLLQSESRISSIPIPLTAISTCFPAAKQEKRLKRSANSNIQPSDIDLAYSKYYQKIKERYQRYVRKILGHNRLFQQRQQQPQDGRWYNQYNNPELLMTHKSHEDDVPMGNDYHNRAPLERSTNEAPATQRTAADRKQNVNATRALIEQLKSQIVRRRRKRNSSISSAPPLTDPDLDTSDGGEANKGAGGKRLRGPCEDLDWDSFANITTVRPGKAPGRNSVGIMLLLECNAGFKLNIKGENATARCIRGIWKPDTPKCLSAPCLVPAVEHGQYYKVEPHTKQLSDKPSLTPLSTYEEIQSNEFITLECQDGFNIQVSGGGKEGSSQQAYIHSHIETIAKNCSRATECASSALLTKRTDRSVV